MILNTFTIIVCIILIIVAVITPFLNPFFKMSKKSNKVNGDGSLPKISIIISSHDNSQELNDHLPAILTQNYEPGYEVIVVSEKSDSATDDILKHYSSNDHLYTTFIPDSSRYMSRKKLAITIGVKAAHYEWILLVEPNCCPISDAWLTAMARNCNDNRNLIIGYSQYDSDSKSFYRFEHLHTVCSIMSRVNHRTAYRTNCSNLMFRKSDFMKSNGFQGNLKYIRGEYDFIVNKYARKNSAVIETNPDAWLIVDNPTKKTWKYKHLYYMETRRHLQRSFGYRMVNNFDTFMMHLNYLLIIAAIAYSVYSANIIISAAAALALIITICLRILFAAKTIKYFKAKVSLFAVIPFEIRLIWSKLFLYIKYWCSNKYDFISHKI
jgi:hypothetical protein